MPIILLLNIYSFNYFSDIYIINIISIGLFSGLILLIALIDIDKLIIPNIIIFTGSIFVFLYTFIIGSLTSYSFALSQLISHLLASLIGFFLNFNILILFIDF